jgi:uncharacterized membrane-anchored protein YhcB (DUF1043 family)
MNETFKNWLPIGLLVGVVVLLGFIVFRPVTPVKVEVQQEKLGALASLIFHPTGCRLVE